MYDLTLLSTTFDAAQHVPSIYAESITDTVTGLATDVMVTLQAVASVIVVGFIILIMVKTRMAAAAIITCAVVGAFVLWLIWGGIDTLKGRTGEQLAVSTQVTHVEDFLPPTASY